MSKEQLIGWGSIALGCALAFAGLFELSTGQFMPGGYHNDVQWLVSSGLLRAFREWGPYLSGVIWVVLAGVCIRMGMGMLREIRGSGRNPL
jgi:hypothetical protein